MIINNELLYEKKHAIILNDTNNDIYYYFDYDERNAGINMEFQHFHPFYEILILLAPEADHLYEGKSYHMIMGDIILLPPYALHKSIYKKGASSKRLLINFMYPKNFSGLPNGFQSLLKPFHEEMHIFRFTQQQRSLLFSKLNEIFRYSTTENFNGSELNELVLHAKFVEFLNILLQIKGNNIYINNADNSPSTQKMYDISSYIHNHYTENLSLDEIAEKFYLSPYYLSHQFKNVTNFTISSYIQMTRIKNAQHQLITTDKKITEIAEACGFSSFSQFNRCFHKLNNISPREYRKNSYLATIQQGGIL